jgi:hypothetical protein
MADTPITVAQLLNYESNSAGFPQNETVLLTDTTSNIESLTPVEAFGISNFDISNIVVTDGSLVLDPLQAALIQEFGYVQIAVPPNDTVTTVSVPDDLDAEQIGSLTAPDIAVIAANGYTTIAATNGSVALSIAQTEALLNAGLDVIEPQGDTISFADTAANIGNATIDLASISPALPSLQAASSRDIYTRAQRRGFAQAAAKVGPQLQLQYFEQPYGEFLDIGMTPIGDARQHACGLAVGNRRCRISARWQRVRRCHAISIGSAVRSCAKET